MTDEKDREITAREFADIMGKDGSWAARLAKQAVKKGNPFPRKRGNYWFATREEWEAVLKILGVQLRNRRKKKK